MALSPFCGALPHSRDSSALTPMQQPSQWIEAMRSANSPLQLEKMNLIILFSRLNAQQKWRTCKGAVLIPCPVLCYDLPVADSSSLCWLWGCPDHGSNSRALPGKSRPAGHQQHRMGVTWSWGYFGGVKQHQMTESDPIFFLLFLYQVAALLFYVKHIPKWLSQ